MTQIFFNADEDRLSAASTWLQNAAFMKVTLEDLQGVINKEGAVEEYQNGEHQHGMKQSATLQSYIALSKNYSTVMKHLVDMLPNRRRNMMYVNPVDAEDKEAELQALEDARLEKIAVMIARAAAEAAEAGRETQEEERT